MKPIAAAPLLGLIAISWLALGGVAKAETVLLSRGDDTFGQGWLFLDPSGKCRVVTPRHVIENGEGELSPPDLVDRYGQIHPTHSPIAAADPDLDLSFLSVGGQLAKNGCSRDRVRATPLQPIIDSLEEAQLDVSTEAERQTITVAIRAVSRDHSGGGIIAISSVDPSITFQKGMSGGTITANGRPIAMLFEVDSDEGIGVALRYDLIAAELQKLKSSPADQSANNHRAVTDLVLAKGRVAGKGSGLSSFLNGKSALELAPAPDRIVLMINLADEAVVKGLRIRGGGLANKGDLIIETDKDRGGFSPGVRCPLSDDLTCRMAPRRATSVRVTLTGLASDSYAVEGLELIEGDG